MRRTTVSRSVVVTAVAALGCSGGGTKYIGSNQTGSTSATSTACTSTPAAPPASLGLAAFYGKYLDANGVPLVSSDKVSDQALAQACGILVHMLGMRDDIRQGLDGNHVRFAVIGTGEVTTNLPEYGDLPTAFPRTNWDQLRGVGATAERPVASCGEENLLCLAGDVYHDESILVEMVGFALASLGIPPIDTTFTSRLQALYKDAMDAGRFANTYAAKDYATYFGIGVQDWFDANREASPPDGNYNEINTRAELKAYDPGLAAMVGEFVPDDSWRPTCP
jgi:hypothetical protein